MTGRGGTESTLELIREADLDAVLALNQQWVPHVGSLDVESLGSLLDEADLALGAWSRAAEGHPGGEVPSRRVRGDLCGFVIVLAGGAQYPSPNYRYFAARHDTFAYVDRVAVSPSARRRGVGRRLYDAAVTHARSAGSPVLCAEVNLDPPNPDSQMFHADYGFVEVGRQWTYGDTVEVQLLEIALS